MRFVKTRILELIVQRTYFHNLYTNINILDNKIVDVAGLQFIGIGYAGINKTDFESRGQMPINIDPETGEIFTGEIK